MAEQTATDNQTTVAGGTLYLVAVPIGNPRDITLRALDILRGVDLIAAEDTREFRPLARVHGIETRTISYHDYNEETRARELLDRLLLGESIAVVSDAGTPLINDPGFRIVEAAARGGRAGHERAGAERAGDGAGGFRDRASPVPVPRLPAAHRQQAPRAVHPLRA